MRTALTIAGSDSSGGAGIQADIKTMISNGVYAMSAITALTAQNTTGVTGIMEATPEFLAEQLDNIFTDIYPDAVKILSKQARAAGHTHRPACPRSPPPCTSSPVKSSAIAALARQLSSLLCLP